MANKQSFTPEEWTKILESVMLAGMAVSAAEPSGLWGLLKEQDLGPLLRRETLLVCHDNLLRITI